MAWPWGSRIRGGPDGPGDAGDAGSGGPSPGLSAGPAEKRAGGRQARKARGSVGYRPGGRGDIWKTSPHPNRRKYPHQFAEAAEKTTRKDRRINIRLSDHDLAGIQRKAAEQGIPYQSLISGQIHQFVELQIAIRSDG